MKAILSETSKAYLKSSSFLEYSCLHKANFIQMFKILRCLILKIAFTLKNLPIILKFLTIS